MLRIPALRSGRYADVLARRDFRLLLAAGMASGIGDWLFAVGLVTYVWTATHSIAWLAAIEIVALVAYMLFASLGGGLADRVERRRALIAADVASAALMVALTVAAYLSLDVWVVACLVFLAAAASTPHAPALIAITPELVSERDLAPANGLLSAVEHAALAAGPALGALALLFGSPSLTFLVNAATFLVSAVLVARIRSRPVVRSPGADRTPLRGRLRAGIAGARASRMTALLVFWCAAGLLYGLEVVLLPITAERLLGIGIEGYGWLLAAAGVGGLIGVLPSGRVRGRDAMRLTGVALFLLAAPFAALAAVHDPLVACAIWAVGGFGTVLGSVVHDTLLQQRIRPDAVGNVAGAFEAVYVGAIIAGSLLAPALVAAAGLRAALALSGITMALAALCALPWLRRLDRAG